MKKMETIPSIIETIKNIEQDIIRLDKCDAGAVDRRTIRTLRKHKNMMICKLDASIKYTENLLNETFDLLFDCKKREDLEKVDEAIDRYQREIAEGKKFLYNVKI